MIDAGNLIERACSLRCRARCGQKGGACRDDGSPTITRLGYHFPPPADGRHDTITRELSRRRATPAPTIGAARAAGRHARAQKACMPSSACTEPRTQSLDEHERLCTSRHSITANFVYRSTFTPSSSFTSQKIHHVTSIVFTAPMDEIIYRPPDASAAEGRQCRKMMMMHDRCH